MGHGFATPIAGSHLPISENHRSTNDTRPKPWSTGGERWSSSDADRIRYHPGGQLRSGEPRVGATTTRQGRLSVGKTSGCHLHGVDRIQNTEVRRTFTGSAVFST